MSAPLVDENAAEIVNQSHQVVFAHVDLRGDFIFAVNVFE